MAAITAIVVASCSGGGAPPGSGDAGVQTSPPDGGAAGTDAGDAGATGGADAGIPADGGVASGASGGPADGGTAGGAPGSPDGGAAAATPGSVQWAVTLSPSGSNDVDLRAGRDGSSVCTFLGPSAGGAQSAARLDRLGRVAWSKGPGDELCGTDVKPLGVADDGSAGIGLAPCPSALSSPVPPHTFAVLDHSGGRVSAFDATRLGLAVMTPDAGSFIAYGWDAGAPLPDPGAKAPQQQAVLRKVRASDGADVWVRRDLAGVVKVEPAGDGGAFAFIAESHQVLLRLGGDGATRWAVQLPDAFSLELDGRPLAPLTDGGAAVAGRADGALSWGGSRVGSDGVLQQRFLLVVGPDGVPRGAVEVPRNAPEDTISWPFYPRALPGGGVLAWGDGPSCGHLWAFGADLASRWDRDVDRACVAHLAEVATDGGAIVAVGWAATTPDFDGIATAPGEQEFAAAYAP